ncbi:hypothetical protein CTM62_08115 [Prevotella intermedia]|uniref:Uncharacterized protein n=1 Tax=Prevotella intermedia TaxID=28131 RepID=A0A2D3L7Y8_PREIN|nr:hypothetical protein CTM62_08115 [Prevotella intermedia]
MNNRVLFREQFPFYRLRQILEIISDFVKIILMKNDNFDLALRKRLFCVAKPTLLPCKTAAFGMQNNRFCNALIYSWLGNKYVYEKYLQCYDVLFVHKVSCFYQIITASLLSIFSSRKALYFHYNVSANLL